MGDSHVCYKAAFESQNHKEFELPKYSDRALGQLERKLARLKLPSRAQSSPKTSRSWPLLGWQLQSWGFNLWVLGSPATALIGGFAVNSRTVWKLFRGVSLPAAHTAGITP